MLCSYCDIHQIGCHCIAICRDRVLIDKDDCNGDGDADDHHAEYNEEELLVTHTPSSIEI